MANRKQRRLLSFAVVLYLWAPAIAVTVIAAIEWGWRPFAFVIAFAAVMGVKIRLGVRELREGKQPLPWPAQMVLFAVLLSVGGWIMIGGAGIVIGIGLGIGCGLPTPRELLPRR